MKKVTVVIPNYNGCHFLKTCLDSLRRQTCQDFCVLVVDNASSDGSVEFLRTNYPEVQVAVMERNLGFSGGVNYGIRCAETPYVILLNNDTESHPDYIREMLRAIEKNNRIFSVSSCMINYYQRDLIDDAGDIYSVIGWGAQRGVGRSVSAYRKPKRVFSACAGAAIYRREVFEQIGLFDEMHFAYLEDIDVGYRANIFGYKNMYAPRAKVYHVGSGTSGSKYNEFKVKLAARNSLYLNYKNMPALQLLLNAPILLLGYGIKMCFFQRIGFGAAYRQGLWEGLKTLSQCNKVVYDPAHWKNYIDIQLQLWEGMWIYTKEFLYRRIGHSGRN